MAVTDPWYLVVLNRPAMECIYSLSPVVERDGNEISAEYIWCEERMGTEDRSCDEPSKRWTVETLLSGDVLYMFGDPGVAAE